MNRWEVKGAGRGCLFQGELALKCLNFTGVTSGDVR